ADVPPHCRPHLRERFAFARGATVAREGSRFRLRPHHCPRWQRNERSRDDVAAAFAAAAARTPLTRQGHARARPSAWLRLRLSAGRAGPEVSKRCEVMGVAICFPCPKAID